MIDIHTHILPKVDDGAPNIEESLKMLQQAQDDGVETVVLTPHILNNTEFSNEDKYVDLYNRLLKAADDENIELNIFLGSEIYVQPEMALDKKMATLNNNGTYFLVEFPMGSIPLFVAEKFFNIIANGMIPIIAHPERNMGFLKRPEFAYEFVKRGALIQVNSGSILGHFGSKVKALTFKLIDHNLVHFVASDCHNANTRRCCLGKARKVIVEKWGHEMAEALFRENAQLVLKGIKLAPPEPMVLAIQSETTIDKIRTLLKKLNI